VIFSILKPGEDIMPAIRKMLSISILVFIAIIILLSCVDADDKDDLLGPIAHIDVQHKRIGDTRYFQLSGMNSYMHDGSLVEYEWHFNMNNTIEYYLYGPFQTLEINEPASYNITLKVTSDDTREDIKSMNLTLRDDGFGILLMEMRINQEPRLVEKLEAERAPPEEKQDLSAYYMGIGALAILVVSEFVIIAVLLIKRSK
jgi:hypothetical protein